MEYDPDYTDPDSVWNCMCGDRGAGWQALDNHLRLMHPDVDREVQWPAPGDAKAAPSAKPKPNASPKKPTATSATATWTRPSPTTAARAPGPSTT